MRSTLCGFNDGPEISGRAMLVAMGPTLYVNIGFDPDYQIDKGLPPNLPAKDLSALVDTGATESCIDSGLAMALNLPIIDRREIGGAGGASIVNMHLAQIHVRLLNFTLYGAFAGVHLVAGGQPHTALIGRTFLQNFRMIYDGTTGSVLLEEPAEPKNR